LRALGLFLTQALVTLVLGTVATLGYTSMVEAVPGSAHTLGLVAFVLAGALVGLFAIKSPVHRIVAVCVLLVIAALHALYLGWIYGQIVDSAATGNAVLGVYMPYGWAGAAFVGGLPLQLTRVAERRRLDAEYRPSDDEVRAFIETHGLFVSPAELQQLAARPKGLKCGICRNAYTGKEHLGSGWKEQWVRCPRSPEHVFHAWDFEHAEWRCPIDKSLLYEPKTG